jgi:hypothetical protein
MVQLFLKSSWPGGTAGHRPPPRDHNAGDDTSLDRFVPLLFASGTPGQQASDVQRVAGEDRFATTATLSAREFPEGAATVHLATGAGFADALAAASTGGRIGAPVLLVARDQVPDATRDAIDTLRAAQVIIVGGPTAVSPEVAAKLATPGP